MKNKKLRLVKIGRHYINPSDVSSISRVKSDLYIVRMISNPDPQFPIWIHGGDLIAKLLEHFEVVETFSEKEEWEV